MRLKSIKTKNYRTLEDLKLSFRGNYCTISGRNNAGKSSVIRLLTDLFQAGPSSPWSHSDEVDYVDDKTQWVKDSPAILVTYDLLLAKGEDPALIAFVEQMSSQQAAGEQMSLSVSYNLDASEGLTVSVSVDGAPLDEKLSKEVRKKIRSSNLLFLYNSTTPHDQYFFGRSRRRMFYDFVISDDEKKALDEAYKHTERKLRKFAKQHTQDLSRVLGRLTEKYNVEVSPPEGAANRRMPLGINLTDRSVEVPLDDWGSGTQNRTHILMAILQANRIKTTDSADDKITPIVVIEEPESFLHPAAQSEFGRMLRELSDELGIQIIATTHSPYMLNLEDPSANILLERAVSRGKVKATRAVDTAGDEWMAPFADHLGIGASEFLPLKSLFASQKSRVLLVEGPIDKAYFDYFKQGRKGCQQLDRDIEVVAYGGKDTLKNTLLLQFVVRNFDRVFVTYDLDAKGEAAAALQRVGLTYGDNHVELGMDKPGRDCIEGLLPESVLSAVAGREVDLVMQLGSKESKARRWAKEELKKRYLAEFEATGSWDPKMLEGLNKAIVRINKALA